MKRKTLISIAIILIMLLNCIAPLASVYAAETSSNTITLNSELYTAVSEYMKNNNVKGFTYNDLLRTITASGSSFSSVKELSLKEKAIDDLSGLEVFTGLETLDLSGNYLTLDSNIEIINNFSSLKSLDLSTNRIDGFSWLTIEGLEYKNLNRQDIDSVKIIEIPSRDSVTDEDDLPDGFETIDGMLSELDIESVDVDITTFRTDGRIWDTTTGKATKAFENKTEVGTDIIDYEDDRIIFTWDDIYSTKAAGEMYYVNARVVNSKHKYYDSEIKLYYIFVDETERGIIFKDENFYKCVKEQLTKNSTTNPSNLDTNSDGKLDRNLYNAAYDKALTLVVSIDDLRNHIKSLICQNEKIQDLTGLEKFIGLETELDVSFNYIDSIEKIIELERNKAEEENKIRNEIKELINQLSNATDGAENTVDYRALIKDYLDKAKAYNEKYNAIHDATTTEISDQTNTELQNLENAMNDAQGLAANALNNINKILGKLEKTYDKSYNMATIQTAGLYDVLPAPEPDMPYKDALSEMSKSELYELLSSELQKLQAIESTGNISTEDSAIIVRNLTTIFDLTFTIPASDGTSNAGGPVSQFIKFCGNQIKEEGTKSQLFTALNYIKEADIRVAKTNSDIFRGYTDYEKAYQITGRLVDNNTDDMLNVVVQLPRLKVLDISVNDIESLATIDELTKLLSLNASDNLLTTIEDVNWGEIEWLTYLNLGYNQLQTYEGLRGTLPNLRALYLNNCLFSGVFDFDFIKYFDKLESISFAGNYYSDLTDFVNRYLGKLKKTDYDSLADYIKYGKGISFSFANQTVTIDAGQVNVSNGSVVTIELPPIFRNIEEMDPYHTTYGVVPGTGTVDEYGKTVMFTNYNSGSNNGTVTIDTVLRNINNNESNIYSVGNGTTCYIKYNVGSESSTGGSDNGNTTPGNTTPGNNTSDDTNTSDDKKDDNPNNNQNNDGTKTLTSDDLAVYEDGNYKYLLVAQPDSTNASLAKTLTDLGLTVKSINGSENYSNDNKKVFTSEVVVLTDSGDDATYDVVVLGDIDGDGDVDSIDSGYSRALKYGTLYADVEDEAERSRLMNAFKETSNFRAADLNQDGSVRTNETAQLLYYRAGLIQNFDAELANLAE